jgi:integrase
MARIQHGWLTKDSGAWLGHFRKNGKPTAERLGDAKVISKTEAREKLRDIIVKELGIVGDGTLTLDGFIKAHWLPLNESQWRPSSRDAVLGILKRMTDKFDGLPISDITPAMLAQFLTSLAEKYSASTVKMCRAYARSVFALAVEDDIIRKNPARGLKMPKHMKPVAHPVLTVEEMQALLKAAVPLGVRTREYALLRLLYVVPLRPGELLALRWRDVDLSPDAATVKISRTIYKGKVRNFTKTTQEGEVQQLPLSELAAAALTEWGSEATHGKPDDYVFPNSDGGPLNADNYLARVLIPLAKTAGIEHINFQQLRRSVATHAQHLGSLKDVSSLLRHKQMQTTEEIYIQTLQATVRDVTEKLDQKYSHQGVSVGSDSLKGERKKH